MSKFLNSIPLPICGLILALVSLGNLFKDYQHLLLGNFFGIIGIALITLIVLKFMLAPRETMVMLRDPIIASVFPNFSMALLVAATFFTTYPLLANLIWYTGVILQYSLLGYFTWYFVGRTHLRLTQLYPSWFIVYVGIGVIPLTAAHFNPLLGQVTFWLALGTYLVLLPLVLWRILIVRQMPEATLPLITVLAAPGSLCLAGYLRDFAHPQTNLLLSLVIISTARLSICIGANATIGANSLLPELRCLYLSFGDQRAGTDLFSRLPAASRPAYILATSSRSW